MTSLDAATAALQQTLWALPFDRVNAAYDLIECEGTLVINEVEMDARRALCLIDLFYLMTRVIGHTFLIHPWIYDRCRMVERDPDNHLDLWAREHYKSTLITLGLTIQEILKNPEITVIIFCYTVSKARDEVMKIKGVFERCELLKELFSDILYEDPANESDVWNTFGINVNRKTLGRKEKTVEAGGLIEGSLIGRHADLLIFDDMVVPDAVTTGEQIRKTTEAYELALSLGSGDYRKRLIGTRYSHGDTYSHLIEKGSIKPRIFPATDTGKVNGNPVCHSVAWWNDIIGSRSQKIVACQYLQDPLANMEKTFDIGFLNWYEVRPDRLVAYLVCDPAKTKDNPNACDTAMLVIGVDKSRHLYLLDGYCHRMSQSERWLHYDYLYKKWIATTGISDVICGYESRGNSDIEYFEEQMRKGQYPKIYKIDPLKENLKSKGIKFERIERMEPDLKKGHIWVPYDNAKNAINPHQPTKDQQNAIKSGRTSLIAKPIKRKDSEGNIYNLTEVFTGQLDLYPYGKKVDFLDAFSRVYDMGIRKPSNLRDKYGSTYVVQRGKPEVVSFQDLRSNVYQRVRDSQQDN